MADPKIWIRGEPVEFKRHLFASWERGTYGVRGEGPVSGKHWIYTRSDRPGGSRCILVKRVRTPTIEFLEPLR